MRSRLLLAGTLATLTLFASFHASAGIVPTRLDCTASGVADYLGDGEGYNEWENIVADGVCVGASGVFDVRLTGSGYATWYEVFLAALRPKLRLTDPETGRSTYQMQKWDGVSVLACGTLVAGSNALAIRAVNGASVGIGSVTQCSDPTNDPPYTQRLGFRWTFLTRNLP